MYRHMCQTRSFIYYIDISFLYVDISWSFKVFSTIYIIFLFIQVIMLIIEEIVVQRVNICMWSQSRTQVTVWDSSFARHCHACVIGSTPAESGKDTMSPFRSPWINSLKQKVILDRSPVWLISFTVLSSLNKMSTSVSLFLCYIHSLNADQVL